MKVDMSWKWMVIVCVALCVPVLCLGFDVNVGVKLGAGFPFFSGQDYKDFLEAVTFLTGVDAYGAEFSTRFKLGFSGGLYVTLGFSDVFALQPEAIFSMGGGAIGFPENEYLYFYKESYNASMIEVPVLIKLRFGYRKGSGEKPSKNTTREKATPPKYTYSVRTKPSGYVMAGPGMAFLLGDGNVVVKVNKEKDDGASGPLPDDFFTGSYPFLVFGAGLEGFSGFLDSVELRYHMGLTSILDESNDLESFRGNNLQLLFGFEFGSDSR